MLYVVLMCMLLSALAVLGARRTMKLRKGHELPPALPGALPLIGHLHLFFGDTRNLFQLSKYAGDVCRELGGIIYGLLNGDIYYIITDPDDVVVAANACANKHDAYDVVANYLGQGLLSGSVEIYSRHRKLLNPAFTPSAVHGYLDVFNQKARHLCDLLDHHSGKPALRIISMLRYVIFESSCLTNFGAHVIDKKFINKYLESLDKVMNLFMIKFCCLQNDFIYKSLGFQNKEVTLLQGLSEMSNNVILQRRINTRKDKKVKNTNNFIAKEDVSFTPYIDYLLELEKHEQFTEKEVKDELATNLVVSFETASQTLSNIILYLGSYAEVQARMYQELKQVLGSDRDVDKYDLSKLVHTKAVINEVLRLAPTAPALPRTVDRDVKLKNFTMRANTYCIILPSGVHHNAAWGADAQQFRPERWLEPASLPSNMNNYAAFSLGKRSCIGKTYAMTIISVFLAHLVRRYEFTSDINKLVFKLEVTAKAASGDEVSIQRREH